MSFEQWVNQLVQELGIQVIAIDGKNLRGSYERESGSRHCILSVYGTSVGVGTAKCRISRMKLQPSLPYWNCLTLKAVLSPLMPWAPKNHRGSDSAGASRLHPLLESHPTLFQQIDTWFETARAEGTLPIPSEHTAEAGIAPKSVKCGRSLDPLPLASGRGMVGTANNCHRRTYPPCGIKPLTRFSSTLAVCLQRFCHTIENFALDARCHLW